MTKTEKKALHQQIADRIVLAREIAGWTQQELADKTGIERSQIAMIETGKCGVTIPVLFSIAGALNLKAGRLLP
jgi:transcriptional regulator with XRE-family HTH domain